MYPPNSTKPTGEANINQYDSAAGATRDCSSLGSQTHHPPPRQQQNTNVVGHYVSGEGSSMRFESGGSSSSSNLFRHRSSPAGFYDQYLPTDPNGFSLGRPNGGPQRLRSEMRFSGGSSSSHHQEHKSLRPISEVEAGMNFGSDHNNNNWNNSSSHHISFTIDQPGKKSKNSEFFNLETQYSMPQTSLEMARMENFMNIPEDSVPCRARAKRGFATHPRSIAERERRTRISGKLKKLQELVPNMDKQTSYADMLDLAVEHIKGLQHQVERDVHVGHARRSKSRRDQETQVKEDIKKQYNEVLAHSQSDDDDEDRLIWHNLKVF